MTSSNYASLKIVNWDFVKKINVQDLRLSKDSKIIRKLIINFLNSSSLFADPSFCPSELVMKYFQLLQISVLEMANHIDSLNQTIEEKNSEIQKLKKKDKKTKIPKYILPPVLFQCVFCSKLFKTRVYLNNHIKRRHPEKHYQIPVDQLPYEEPKIEHTVKTVTNVPELSQDLGPFKAEINAMVDHFDTILKNEQTSIRTEFMEQFNKIDMIVQETLRRFEEEKINTIRRNKGSTDASYSDDEAMNERLKANDDSSDTHVYFEQDEQDNENGSLTESNESYSYNFSLEEGQFRKSQKNNSIASEKNSSASNNTPTNTATIKNGSPIFPQPRIPSKSASSATANDYTQADDYYSYSYYYEDG